MYGWQRGRQGMPALQKGRSKWRPSPRFSLPLGSLNTSGPVRNVLPRIGRLFSAASVPVLVHLPPGSSPGKRVVPVPAALAGIKDQVTRSPAGLARTLATRFIGLPPPFLRRFRLFAGPSTAARRLRRSSRFRPPYWPKPKRRTVPGSAALYPLSGRQPWQPGQRQQRLPGILSKKHAA